MTITYKIAAASALFLRSDIDLPSLNGIMEEAARRWRELHPDEETTADISVEALTKFQCQYANDVPYTEGSAIRMDNKPNKPLRLWRGNTFFVHYDAMTGERIDENTELVKLIRDLTEAHFLYL